MSYWDVYRLAVPIRKWLINRYNKHAAQQESGNNSPDSPMSQAERIKMIKQSEQNAAQTPQNPESFMKPRRNQ